MNSLLAAMLALCLLGADAFQVSPARFVSRQRTATRRGAVMIDFGLLKGTPFDFREEWDLDGQPNPVLSEAMLEEVLNKDGLRYRLNRTVKEAEEIGPLGPDIGPIRAPRVASIWEALGFAATSNNEARQNEKLAAIAKQAVIRADPAKQAIQKEWLQKYGYKKSVGDWFYADQLSSDKEDMGGFNMKKGGYYPDGSYKSPSAS